MVDANGSPRPRRTTHALVVRAGAGALATLGYMVAQADKRESKVIQAIPIAFVSAIVTAGLLVVVFLDNPYSDSNGSIRPTEMTRTLDRIDKGVEAPCDELAKPI